MWGLYQYDMVAHGAMCFTGGVVVGVILGAYLTWRFFTARERKRRNDGTVDD